MNGKWLLSVTLLGILLLLALFTPSCGQEEIALSESAVQLSPVISSAVAPMLGPVSIPNTPTSEPTVEPTETGFAAVASSPTVAPTASPIPSPVPTSDPNPIVAENQKAGATGWRASSKFPARDQFSQIAGFADQVSINLGGTIDFAISTRTPGLTYTLAVYRLGWYNGDGARLMHQVTGLKGQAQGYWDPWHKGIANCPTCEIDAKTGLVDTHWASSYSLTVPQDWISGEYLVKLTGEQGQEAYITFVVRDDSRTSDILVQIPVNTYQAYNNWGGNSLYGPMSNTPYSSARAVKVSFNRPISRNTRRLNSGFIQNDIQTIRFLEKNGYDVTYTTSVDVDRDPASLKNHRAFISVGHDEYWTMGMRNAVTAARDGGVNLGFFGGNDIYWQARYEPDREGNPRRVLVVYRYANEDPMAKTDPKHTTVRWISPPVNRPQNSLTGMIYAGRPIDKHVAWVVASSAPKELLAGTGLKPGDKVPRLVGPECDTVVNNGHQPPNLTIVAASTMQDFNRQTMSCNSTWYQTAQGAYVFYAGTTGWTRCLDDFGQPKAQSAADPRMMKFTQNILAAFGVQPATPTTP